MIICDSCNKTGRGRYKTLWMEVEEGKKELMTLCWECLGESQGTGRSDKEMFEHISTPLWVHAGLKPTKQDLAKVKYMKSHNMSWGDLRKERDAKLAKNEGAYKSFQAHIKKYGTKNAPKKSFYKTSNKPK